MDSAQILEGLDTFYLGTEVEPDNPKKSIAPFLYKNKNLTTHAAIIGMTGSGKTGLGISIIEEAALDGIPVIVIDPKGDMGNLMLAFPELRPEDFLPWIDEQEALSKGMSPLQLAEKTAKTWRQGLLESGQPLSRISRFVASCEREIFTPGSSAATPVSILGSLDPPGSEVLSDIDTLNSLIDSTVSSILALCGIESTSMTSREHLLLSNLLLYFWKRLETVTMESLIASIINPPFEKLGVLPLETIYPSSNRMTLAMSLNTILASPGFSAWIKGKPLDISSMLYSQDGRPRISIFTLSHLDENERQFFVTLLLGRFLSWLRRQPGSSRLRVLLYMDEISGYFPPVAMPPSKRPMLLLLKQARAFGAGIVLSTQNPVDLDYKGLSNIGTWFIGRLQTKQDQDRVLTGLKSASDQDFDEQETRGLLSSLPKRTFLMRCVHEKEPVTFKTRWVMSYLKGPLTLESIKKLKTALPLQQDTDDAITVDDNIKKIGLQFKDSPTVKDIYGSPTIKIDNKGATRPILSKAIPQYFLIPPVAAESFYLEPALVGTAQVRFFNSARGIDIVEEHKATYPLDETTNEISWKEAEKFEHDFAELSENSPENSVFAPLPSIIEQSRTLSPFLKSWKDYLYHNCRLRLFRVKRLKLESNPGESEQDFSARVLEVLREKKAEEADRIRQKYEKRYMRLEERLERALQRLEKEKEDVSTRGVDTAVSFGVAILGALFGRKILSSSTATRAGRGIRSASRMMKEKQDVKRAQEEVERIKDQMQLLEQELGDELARLEDKYSIENYEIEHFYLRPRRADIMQPRVFLLWTATPL